MFSVSVSNTYINDATEIVMPLFQPVLHVVMPIPSKITAVAATNPSM